MNFKSILYLREAALTDTQVLVPRKRVFLVIMIARQIAYRPEWLLWHYFHQMS